MVLLQLSKCKKTKSRNSPFIFYSALVCCVHCYGT